jgi:peptidoglycan/xylan/chitin deacetylase (PgdA/CDA1 family)
MTTPLLALKVDVDTDRGTAKGVGRLSNLLENLDAHATFLFSLGPDHTGRAARRIFRRGFMRKVHRTSVLKHYGVRTLLYGTLLPGPHIGRRRAGEMRAVERDGFEVGVHCYDHVKWQDKVASADDAWTHRELSLAQEQFAQIFGRPAAVHGAAGWQMNASVPRFEQQLGFRYASDTRGYAPFRPVTHGTVYGVPQLPTTLPTLDEIIGRSGSAPGDIEKHLLRLTETPRDHVFTLHAELEGGEFLDVFSRLVQGWRMQGYRICDLATLFAGLDLPRLPMHAIARGRIGGRSGTLAIQGPPLLRAA